MAGKSLGALTIDLIANIGGFVAGMNRAERSTDEWRRSVESNVKAAGAAVAGMAAIAASAAVAATGAGISLLKTTSEQVVETDRWAKSLKMSTQELLAWQFAAEKAGLTGDNIADIFKDINDKIGDAVLNNSGEAVEALDSLGLSAKKLSEQSPDKQLLAIGRALEKIPTQAGKTTILESLGNDLSKLLPLFDNNNEKLEKFIQLSKDFGIAPPQEDIDKLIKVNEFFQDLETQAKSLKMEIATGLANVDLSALLNAFGEVREVLTDPKVLDGLVDLIGGIAEVATWLVKAAAAAGELASFSNNRVAALGGNIDLSNIEQINERIRILQDNLSNRTGVYSQGQSMFGWLSNTDDSVKGLNDKLNQLIATRDKLLKAPASSLPTQPASVAVANQFALGSGEKNGKPTASVNKLESAYKSLEQSYLRQIELIDTTGKKNVIVTEQQKLSFDIVTGKLTGLNDVQKKRLEQLAAEVDGLNAVKKANEDNLKVAEFAATLQKQNDNAQQNLNIDIMGAWEGDEYRSRLKEVEQIKKEFNDRQFELNQQFSRDGDAGLYKQQTDVLNEALEERLKIQEEHYKKVDELQNNGTAGFVSGMATQIEASMDLYSNMQQVGAQAFSSLTDMIVQWAETGKLNAQDFASTFLQSIGSALLSYAAAQVAMAGLAAFTSMIGVPYVGPAIAPGAAIAAAAAAGVLAIGVGSALKGQAHDGIDSVPETGTWLLQKGERVTTAQTSAKLDATLERVASSSSAGISYAPVMHFNVNGDPSAAQIAMMKKAVADGANQGYQKAVNSIATRQGDLHRVMMDKTNAGVKKR